eukprot:2238949-Lingulodinium_polyedra.AAC.1
MAPTPPAPPATQSGTGAEGAGRPRGTTGAGCPPSAGAASAAPPGCAPAQAECPDMEIDSGPRAAGSAPPPTAPAQASAVTPTPWVDAGGLLAPSQG